MKSVLRIAVSVVVGAMGVSSVALADNSVVHKADNVLPPHAGSTPVPPGAAPAVIRKSVDQTASLIREAALALLKEGNERFVSDQKKHPNQSAERRTVVVTEGQKPFATILACSDSRSPVEVVFDRGVGDLFVVRVAGNVAGPSELGTIEYGVGHLNTPLLVVLGHTGCGAVGAACKGAELHGHLPQLIERIKPAVDRAKVIAAEPDKLVSAAIQANVWHTIEEVIVQSSEVRDQIREGGLQVIGAVYDLQSGVVTWLGAHPKQEQLMLDGEKEKIAKESAPDSSHTAPGHAPASTSHAAVEQQHGEAHAAQVEMEQTQDQPIAIGQPFKPAENRPKMKKPAATAVH